MTQLTRMLVAFALAHPGFAIAAGEPRFTFQEPQSIIPRHIVDLHAIILVICIAIAVVVFAFMFYAIVRHRKAAGHQARQFHGSTPVEILWAVIPFLIVAGMAYPATRTVIEMKDTTSPDLTVKVTGYQWKWRYTYPDENIDFYNALSTPRDQIANLEPKQDAIAGFARDSWFKVDAPWYYSRQQGLVTKY
jgi:cytochrome c oxidase subunit 2